ISMPLNLFLLVMLDWWTLLIVGMVSTFRYEERYNRMLQTKIVQLAYQGLLLILFFFFQAEDGIRDLYVTGVQTCALPIFVATARSTASETTSCSVARRDLLMPQPAERIAAANASRVDFGRITGATAGWRPRNTQTGRKTVREDRKSVV